MSARVQCASTTSIPVEDGRELRIRCQRSTWSPLRFCEGPHRAEYAPPVVGPDDITRAQVISWT